MTVDYIDEHRELLELREEIQQLKSSVADMMVRTRDRGRE